MRTRFHVLFVAVGLVALTGFEVPSLRLHGAETVFPPVSARQPLRVIAPQDAYPYSFLNEKGAWDGFSTDVVDAVARVMRLPFERRPAISRELQSHFQAGDADLGQHVPFNPEREAWADFSVPLLTLQGAVFVSKSSGLTRIGDLEGKVFAIYNVNSTGERFLRARGIHVRFVSTDSPAAALRMVQDGTADGTFVSQLTGLALARRAGLDRVVPLPEAIEGFDIRHCVVVRKGDAQLLARFNEGLAILHRTGEFDRIYRKWFGQFGAGIFTREETITYVAAALALACVILVWGLWRQRTLRRRIEELNAALEARVSERTAELHARVAEVEHLNAELEAFSYSVSHDLRAPLRNIGGFLELLRKRLAGQLDAEAERFLDTVSREVDRMGTMISALLQFSQVGRSELQLGRVDLDQLVAEVRAELQPAAAGRSVEWRLNALPAVRGDRVLLRQVFANLLGNALKFSRGRETTVIEIGPVKSPLPGQVAFSVRDNGAGFDPKYTAKLFGVFQRLHGQREFEGSGIGLANVKRIVERHQGRVWAEGRLGQGAEFFVSLPAARFAGD